ncbi:MAG: hypothetical protein Q9196_000301 [Gyalolechia fulgens]
MKTYDAIEKVLVAILASLKITVKDERDQEGHHTFHLKVLRAIDDSKLPLFRLLRILPTRKSTTSSMDDSCPYGMIDSLRKLRNEASYPFTSIGKDATEDVISTDHDCSYLCWCIRIFGALLAGFVVCVHEQDRSVIKARCLSSKEITSMVHVCVRTLACDHHCPRHDRELYQKLRRSKEVDRININFFIQRRSASKTRNMQDKSQDTQPPYSAKEQNRSGAHIQGRVLTPEPSTTKPLSPRTDHATRSPTTEGKEPHSQMLAVTKRIAVLEEEAKKSKAENTLLQKKLDDSRERLKPFELQNRERSRMTIDRLSNRLRWAEDTIKSLQAANQKLRESTEKEPVDAEEKVWRTVKQRLSEVGMMEYLRAVPQSREADAGFSREGDCGNMSGDTMSSETGW